MEKLPQRNLLLPNAPITPFAMNKKSKHALKQLLSTSGIFIYQVSFKKLIFKCNFKNIENFSKFVSKKIF